MGGGALGSEGALGASSQWPALGVKRFWVSPVLATFRR